MFTSRCSVSFRFSIKEHQHVYMQNFVESVHNVAKECFFCSQSLQCNIVF